jgi:hypothetical protein
MVRCQGNGETQMFAIWQVLKGHNNSHALIGYVKDSKAAVHKLHTLKTYASIEAYAINDEGIKITVH